LVEKLKLTDVSYKPETNLSLSTSSDWRAKMDDANAKGSNYDLLRAIGRYNQGVTYNPYLTNPASAHRWLRLKKKMMKEKERIITQDGKLKVRFR
jgi:hypothetical protein